MISKFLLLCFKNEFITQLIGIREKTTEIFEQQIMLETRILCQFLPCDYGDLQNFITTYTYMPLNNEQKSIQINNQRYKIIQDAKRQWLNISLSIHEMKLQEYDQQYQEILIQLKSLLLSNTSLHGETLFNQINEYMANRTKELKQTIMNKIPVIRGKLLRNHQRSLSTKTMISLSPEPYLDSISNPFDTREWHILSLGKFVFFF
jgi:hypothetical protein